MDDRILLDEVKRQERHIAKLERKLGRCAWHRNQGRKTLAELQAMYAAAAEEGAMVRKVLGLDPTTPMESLLDYASEMEAFHADALAKSKGGA